MGNFASFCYVDMLILCTSIMWGITAARSLVDQFMCVATSRLIDRISYGSMGCLDLANTEGAHTLKCGSFFYVSVLLLDRFTVSLVSER